MKKAALVIMLLLLSLVTACNPTEISVSPAIPLSVAAHLPQSQATPAPDTVSPSVLETIPAAGAELPIDGAIEITFDQPMNRDSVERAFAIEPGASADGEFEWVDDQTVRFTLRDGFERGEQYRVRVVDRAESADGLPLAESFELRFSVAGFLEVTNVQPGNGATEILPNTIVTVMFNRPVVPLNAIAEADTLPDPLTFVPPVRGEGEWLNTSIYQFVPTEGFDPATTYLAQVSSGLEDTFGVAVLADEFEWTFTTFMPAAIASVPGNEDVYVLPDASISLTFNQPMDRASVEENFVLTDEDSGATVAGSFTWTEEPLEAPDGRDDDNYYSYAYDEGQGPTEIGVETVEFTPDEPLDMGDTYSLFLPAGTRGAIGEGETLNDYNASFTVIPEPEIVSTSPDDGETGVNAWQSFQVRFNAPIDRASIVLGENIIIEPPVSYTEVYSYWWSSNTRAEFSFPKQASSVYTVTIGEGIVNRAGHELDGPTTVSWQTAAASPLLYMYNPGRVAVYNTLTDTMVYVNVRNIAEAHFALYRLPIDDFIRLNGDNWWSEWDGYNPGEENLITTWKLDARPFLNQSLVYGMNMAEKAGLGDVLPPGLYYVEASFPDDAIYEEARDAYYFSSTERMMFVVSNYNLTFKSSTGDFLAWMTDLETGQPVEAGIPITFMDEEETITSETGADGIAIGTFDRRDDAYMPRFIFSGNLDDPSEFFAVATSRWDDGISRYQFSNVSTEDYQSPFSGEFYTDRNIYRPGQEVHFKGILRHDDDSHYSLPTPGDSMEIFVYDSQGNEIFNDVLPLNEMGTVNGTLQLAEDAALGFYSLEANYVDARGEDHYFYDEFQVAAYRPPEYIVTVETDKAEYAQGETVNVTAQAEFFFGGAVSEAEVRWTLLSDDYVFQYQGQGSYDFNDYDFSRRYGDNYYGGFGTRIADGTGVTDGQGRFTFSVNADIASDIASQRYTFDVVVTDINNQEVAAQGSAIIHKGDFYVGLSPERYVGRAEEQNNMNIQVVDWQSDPVADQEIQVVFAEHNWYSVQRQYSDGSFYWDSYVEDVPVATTTVVSNEDGQAIADFVPASGGIYKIIASGEDANGNTVQSSTYIWVSGSRYINWRQENNDRLDLVTDRREYQVGDTATILIPHPYSGTVQALVTLERGRIYDQYVLELPTNSEQIEIEITEDMVPNMYVGVTIVKGVDAFDDIPSFKVGYASLPINNRAKELNITLTPDRTGEEVYQPQDTAQYNIRVTDAQGQPVQAELSLALVDKAVLSLSPNTPDLLLNNFWRDRGLGVRTGANLALSIDRVNIAVAPEAKGGGGGFLDGAGDIRGDFRDTAFWVADFMTDENGEGVVEATLPDNLTTWTMTAYGVTAEETLVGEDVVEIISTKPMLVRPVAPRFFVVDDEARMGMIVQNNTFADLDITAVFEADGLTVEPVGDTEITVAGRDRVLVEYDINVEDVSEVTLTMGATSDDGEFTDAVEITVPVYRFSTPETVATVGILETDGTRTEGVSLPRNVDASQGELTIKVDPSLAAGMRDGLDYLEHFPYECTEQTVSRFLPNLFTYRAYQALNVENPELEERLPDLVSVALQRLYGHQKFDGGWGWFIRDESDPFLTAWVLYGMLEAERSGFSVSESSMTEAIDFLEDSLEAPKDVAQSWRANRQAFILYVLAEAGAGDQGRNIALFAEREKLDYFGRAYLAMAMYIMDPAAGQIDTLVNDLTSSAIVSASGAHWEESQVDYFAMNTDTRSTAIIIAALSRIQPDNPILPNAVRWLMTIRENGGHWETTQETAWAIIGLTDWMVVTGELEGVYDWQVLLNGDGIGEGSVDSDNIDETTTLRVEVGDLLLDELNRLSFERTPTDGNESPGRMYYAAYLQYYLPVPQVQALDRGIIVSRQYFTIGAEGERQSVAAATVGDTIEVKLTLIAPNDLHYVLVEDFFPAGAEGIDTSLATTSAVAEAPEIERTDRNSPWGRYGYGWWYFSHAELRDEKAVLFATYLPKGTYEYTYQIRASLPGEFNVIPTHAEQMYFPEVFGRGDGMTFRITQE